MTISYCRSVFFLALSALAMTPSRAQVQSDGSQELAQFNASLNYQTAHVDLPAAHASFDLNGGYRFLAQADARRVLEQLWGNPEDDSVLGMIVPGDREIIDSNAWAVVLTYSDEGHVSDDDAAKIDYAALLEQMQSETAESNAARKEAGYGTVDLIGWAQEPRYDAAQKKLHWAKELAFEGVGAHTLNYDIRALGRDGYLSMNAVADMDSLAAVESGMQQILPMVQFTEGHRYADFNPDTDRAAGYGLAALVGGVAASKMGLFAKLGILLLKMKKLAILLVFAIGAGIKYLLGRKKAEQ